MLANPSNYKMNKRLLYWIFGVLALAVLAYFVYSKFIKEDDANKVAVEESKKRTLIESISASGKLYPEKEVKISPDVSGEIVVLNVQEGDEVRRGQLLATIDAQTYRSGVNRAQAQLNQTQSNVQNAKAQQQQFKAQLEQARATYNRNNELFKEQVISASEFETAVAAYKSAQANYKASMATIKGNQYGVASARANVTEARQQLRRTTIYAPMSGTVSALFVKKGERVVGTMQMAGTEMMRISQMGQLKIDVEVGENDIVKVKMGDSTKIEIEAYGTQAFYGRVSQITQAKPGGIAQAAASMNDQVTNYTVSVTLDPESYKELQEEFPDRSLFRPGMSASVEIYTRQKEEILAVPINAVTTREDEDAEGNYSDIIKEYVFIDSASYAVLREVKTGLQDNKYVEILSGLKNAEKVLTAPYGAIARKLKNKDKIEVVDKEDLYEEEE